MAVSAARVTASTSAVALNPANGGGRTLTVKNLHATDAADLGASTVTAGAGFPLAAGVTVQVQLEADEVLYAIRSAAADVSLAVLRT